MMDLEKAYHLCCKKFETHMKKYPAGVGEFTGACLNGDYYGECAFSPLFEMYNWTSSFVTGLAPLLYRTEKKTEYLRWANSFAGEYYEKIFKHAMDTMHDLGFLYMPYSAALYQLTGNPMHRVTALKAADELAKRFDVRGGYIDAWRRMDNQQQEGRAIIDCMMNLPLLFWAYAQTGHTCYRDIAEAHAEMTRKIFIRPDFTVCHSFLFDRETGAALRESNACGYSDGSYWARGTAWAVYGFAVAARYLKSDAYYTLAVHIAEKFVSSLPENTYIPVWDFRLPKDEPAAFCGTGNAATDWDTHDPENCQFNVDSSAAAILACGILELNAYRKTPDLMQYVDHALAALCSNTYLDADSQKAGLLKRQNGQMIYTLYGDFFFAEALQRRLFDTETCW